MKYFSFFFLIVLFVSCNTEVDDDSGGKIQRFVVKVNTNLTNSIENADFEDDRCVLLLPDNYSINASDKTRLVIYCHSGGGTVSSNSSEAENSDFVQYLVSLGYAVLSVAGMPESYAKRLHIDINRTVGSIISVRATVASYKYVITHYNISNDGCFLFSNSNGGLLASNIVSLTSIPVLAQSGLAPLLSIEKNAWFIPSGAMSATGKFEQYQNRANIIALFGMHSVETQSELNNAIYEKEKVGKYDPFDYYMNQTIKPYPVPYLMFSLVNDITVSYKIAVEFADRMNQRGSNIYLSDISEYGAHNVPPNNIIVGEYKYLNSFMLLKLTVKEVADFFNTFNPDC